MPADAELVVDARAYLGEGPVWDADREVLWWVDILAGVVHAFEPASGRDRTIEIGQAVGAVALRAGGGLVILGQDAILALDPETGRLSALLAFERSHPPLRSNDAKCDPAGRLWIDRMTFDHLPGAGSLLRLDTDLRLVTVREGLTIPNGLEWSTDGRTMYFVDSSAGEITAFDVDAKGLPGSARTLYRHEGPGGPDGLARDEEDCVWAAIWGGSCVVRVAADGRLLARHSLPVSRVSSCTFGGAALDELYVTTAREDFTPEDDAREPTAGGLFRIRPGVRGVAARPFRG